MDTVHPDDSNRVLPSARELLMHGRDPLANNYNGQQQDPNADKMQIDEPSFHPPETTEHTNGPGKNKGFEWEYTHKEPLSQQLYQLLLHRIQ